MNKIEEIKKIISELENKDIVAEKNTNKTFKNKALNLVNSDGMFFVFDVLGGFVFVFAIYKYLFKVVNFASRFDFIFLLFISCLSAMYNFLSRCRKKNSKM